MIAECTRICVAVACAASVVAALAASAVAGPLEDAVAAFNRADFATALRGLRPLADRGNGTAQSKLGFMFELGLGVPENYVEAIKWHLKAATQGEIDSQIALGRIYGTGQSVPRNYAEAARWYRKAADQGNLTGQSNIGLMYDQGRGVAQNYAEAAKWYRKAADQGDPSGQVNLGLLYLQGHGVPQDYAEARKWFLKAAEQGRATAQFRLGVMYENADGVAQDYAEAMKWYRKAADRGDATAPLMIGAMYDNGKGVSKNDGEALKWYRMAADRGHATAQLFLGDIYASGKGTPQNYILAHLWLNRAAASEPSGEVHDNAVRILGLIARSMTPAQIAGAQTLWRQCIASDYKNCVPEIPAPPSNQVARRDDVPPAAEARRSASAEAGTAADDERRRRAGFLPGSDRAGNVKRCLQVQGEEMEKTAKCVETELRRLGHNQTEPAAVVADAIVGLCRARDAVGMEDRYFQFCGGFGMTPADYDKIMNHYFARVRDTVLSKIVEARTPQPHSPTSQSARAEDKVSPSPATLDGVTSTGTGFFVSDRGHIVTNAHVVAGCRVLRASSGGPLRKVAVDEESDLALYTAAERPGTFARLRGGRGARPGEPVVAVGFPLSGLLSTDPIVTTGVISALSGIGNDRRRIQITAPLQPGNSGGPLLGENGSVVGVAVEKLDALKFAEILDDLPQNVNFAVSAGTLQSFLNAKGVPYALDDSKATKSPADIAAEAAHYTVLLECVGGLEESSAPVRGEPKPTRPGPAPR